MRTSPTLVGSIVAPPANGAVLTCGAMLTRGGGLVEQMPITLCQVVLDCTDARTLAEFYRELLGLRYRPGDEPASPGEPDPKGQDWLVLRSPGGGRQLAFQQVAQLPEVTWPDGPHPQMLHLDLTVATVAEFDAQHGRALALGARLLYDRSADPEEPLRVYADPAGHPFCVFVADPSAD
jgi:catechol 2,3-dioxygenase-like lactoylglutathione lyase family enzyme